MCLSNSQLQTSRAASADLQSQLESAAGVYRQQAQQQRKIDSLQQQVQSLKERLKEKESQLRQRDSEISEVRCMRFRNSCFHLQYFCQSVSLLFLYLSVLSPITVFSTVLFAA